jgi:hypothetical protein
VLNWQHALTRFDAWSHYGAFVAGLCGLQIKPDGEPSAGRAKYSVVGIEKVRSYSIITFNYDSVLETVLQHITNHTRVSCDFERKWTDNPKGPFLVKLHGTVDHPTGIIPPTWHKTLADEDIRRQWELAYRVLSQANQIRFIGYSLPEADAYVRYLLRASISGVHFHNIRTIDVINPDATSA